MSNLNFLILHLLITFINAYSKHDLSLPIHVSGRFEGIPLNVSYRYPYCLNSSDQSDLSCYSVRADWPGSTIRFTLLNKFDEESQGRNNIEISLSFLNCIDNCNYFVSVFIDCSYLNKFQVSSGTTKISFFIPYSSKTLTEVSLTKITEASNSVAQGVMELGRIETTESSKIIDPILYGYSTFSSCSKKDFNILVIGDSISAAYGVDGIPPCSFSTDSEDVMESYAEILANRYNSEIQVIAWSGKGVVRNYGDIHRQSDYPMPFYYNKTLATTAINDKNDYWQPYRFIPDVVMISLGTNDFSTTPHPIDEVFISGYTSLINQIFHDYPKTKVLAICEPIFQGNQCIDIEKASLQSNKSNNVFYIPISDSVFSGGYGCDGHPSKQTQINIADALDSTLGKLLGVLGI